MASAELIDDPFEARLRFIDVLKHVTASQKTIHGATAFALKNAHADDELFSCLLETLQGGSVSLSQRLNILSVADAIASEAAKPGARDSQYLMLVKEHAKDIVDAAIPSDDPKSEVNRPIVQRIVEKWIRKGIASNELLQHIHQLQSSAFSNKDAAFSKQEVQKRMEDDWERSRRSKEEAWRQESIESQFEKLYERSNALNLDDVSHIQSELRHWRRWKKAVEEEPLRVLIWDFNDLFIKGRRHYRNDPRKGDDVLDEIRRLARKCHARFLETKSLPHRTLLEPHSEIDPAWKRISNKFMNRDLREEMNKYFSIDMREIRTSLNCVAHNAPQILRRIADYSRDGTNLSMIILSSHPMATTLLQLVIYNLDDLISISEVYSYHHLGPGPTCRMIEERYGMQNEYVLLSSGTSVSGVARERGWKVVNVCDSAELERLYQDPFKDL